MPIHSTFFCVFVLTPHQLHVPRVHTCTAVCSRGVFVLSFTSITLCNHKWRDHCAEHYIFIVVIATVIKGRGEISLVARYEYTTEDCYRERHIFAGHLTGCHGPIDIRGIHCTVYAAVTLPARRKSSCWRPCGVHGVRSSVATNGTSTVIEEIRSTSEAQPKTYGACIDEILWRKTCSPRDKADYRCVVCRPARNLTSKPVIILARPLEFQYGL